MTNTEYSNLPPMPAIGETIHHLGGTITRKNERLFSVTRADGRLWQGANRARRPEVALVSATNCLRHDADLVLLPVPCLYCGVKPRVHRQSYCCVACRRDNKTMPEPPLRQPFEAAPRVEMADALRVLHSIAPDPLLQQAPPHEQNRPVSAITAQKKDNARVSPTIALKWANDYIRRREQECAS